MNKDYDPFKDGIPKKDEPPKDPSAEPGPDVDKLLEEERQLRQQAEQKWEQQQQFYEGRLQELGDFLKTKYQDKQNKQDAPADPEPEITDADFDKSPSKAAKLAAQREMKETLGKVNEYYSGVIGNLAEQAFESQLEALKTKRFYKYVEADVKRFFDENPQAKLSPRAAATIYAQFTGGDNIDMLITKEEEDQKRQAQQDLTLGEPPRRPTRQPVMNDGPRPPAPRVPSSPAPAAPKLADDEREIFDIYRRYGVFEDENDWQNWKTTIGMAPRQEVPGNMREA